MPKLFICTYHKGGKYGIRDISGNTTEVEKKQLFAAIRSGEINVLNIDILGHKTNIDIKTFIKTIINLKSNCKISELTNYAHRFGIYDEYTKYISRKVKEFEGKKEIKDTTLCINDRYMRENNYHCYGNMVDESEVARYYIIYGHMASSVDDINDTK